MFEFLIKKLKAHPRKIVFTEGTDPRILEAAARLKKAPAGFCPAAKPPRLPAGRFCAVRQKTSPCFGRYDVFLGRPIFFQIWLDNGGRRGMIVVQTKS